MSHSIINKFHAYLLTERRVAHNTFAAYKKDLDQYLDYLKDKKIPLTAVAPAQIKEYLAYLRQTLGLNTRSVTRKISSLKVFYNYAHDYADFPNLAQDLIFPKLEKKLPQYLTEDQIQKLLIAAEQDLGENHERNKIILYVMYVTGMRVSELISCKISQLHFDTGFIEVNGKGGKARMVPIPQPVLELIKEYLAHVHAAFMQNGKRQTDYLFPIFYGGKVKPITRQAVWGILKHLCKKAGLEGSIFPHQLRHSLATHMLKEGVDLRSLQILLGHENVATVQIYTHLETSHLRSVYDKKHPRS